MDIFILRHAEAEPRSPDATDEDRALTAKGKRELRFVLGFARAAKVAPQAILTSRLVRARQTAAAAAKALDAPIVETRHLLPAAAPDRLWKQIGGMQETESVMLVGHEPHLSNLMRFLLESAVAVDLKKGALARIEIKNRTGSPRGVLKWMITPKLARAR